MVGDLAEFGHRHDLRQASNEEWWHTTINNIWGREAKRTVDINDCPYKYLLTLAEGNILLKLVDLSLTLSTD